jgi:membrane protein
MGQPADAITFVLTVARLADEHEIKYPAAAFAYYSFVSFLPLLALVVAVVGQQMGEQIRRVSPRVFTPEAQQLVSESITSATGRSSAIMLAIAVFGWSVTNIVTDLQTAIERVEGHAGSPLAAQLSDAVKILASLLLVIVSVVLLGGLSVLLPSSPRIAHGWSIGLFVVLTVALVPLYSLPSRVVSSTRDALPGATTAAFGLATLFTAIRTYAVNAPRYAIYGVLSGIIILLTSLYFAAFVLMIGFIVNAVALDRDSTSHR